MPEPTNPAPAAVSSPAPAAATTTGASSTGSGDSLDSSLKAAFDKAGLDLTTNDEDTPKPVAVTDDIRDDDPEPEPAKEPAKPAATDQITPDGTVAAEATEAEPAAESLDEFDKILKAEGYEAKRPDGRDNRIPYSKTKKIIENAKTKWQAEYDAAQAPTRERLTKAEARNAEVDSVEKIMASDPDRYMRMLAAVEPAYAKFLNGGSAPAAAEPGKTSSMPATDFGEPPAPDLTLPDGAKTYSTEGFAKRLQWEAAKAKAEAKAEALAEVEKLYGPIRQEREQAAEAQARIAAALPKINQQLDAAEKWEGFVEHQNEILDALQKDKSLTLKEAYFEVVTPKLRAKHAAAEKAARDAEAAARKKIIAEMKSTPMSTTTAVVGTTAEPKEKDINTRIAERAKAAGIEL